MKRTDPIEAVMGRHWPSHTFRRDDRHIDLAFLIRESDSRPLKADWWRGKDVYIIAGDFDGNFILRHCDGTIRYWQHRLRSDVVIASSVRSFVDGIE